ncbi:hypothetical protein TNCV_3458951 [Trichonephila clavipes]|nr:hypothetical protein TNCV_3458951 [Trichonephila clavipes]
MLSYSSPAFTVFPEELDSSGVSAGVSRQAAMKVKLAKLLSEVFGDLEENLKPGISSYRSTSENNSFKKDYSYVVNWKRDSGSYKNISKFVIKLSLSVENQRS